MKLTSDQLAALKRFKPVMEGFSAVLTFLDDNSTLESLQQAHTETEARLSDKRKEEEAVDARIAAAALAEENAKALVRQSRVDTDAVREAAYAECEKMKEDAAATAEALLDRAKQMALKTKKDAQAELPDIEAQIEHKRSEFTQLADACDEKRAELQDIETKKNAALEHIQVLLNGK